MRSSILNSTDATLSSCWSAAIDDHAGCRELPPDVLLSVARLLITFLLVQRQFVQSFMRSGIPQRPWPYRARRWNDNHTQLMVNCASLCRHLVGMSTEQSVNSKRI